VNILIETEKREKERESRFNDLCIMIEMRKLVTNSNCTGIYTS